MEKKEARWLKCIPVLIAVTSLLTAISVYTESDLSIKGTGYLNDATSRLVAATNSYTMSTIHGSSWRNAELMVKAFSEIANDTGDEASLIQARYWGESARYHENMSRTAYDRYRQRMEEGFYPVKEKATEAMAKASGFVVPIILFQVSLTLMVATQVTRRKVLLILGLGMAIVGTAYLIPLLL